MSSSLPLLPTTSHDSTNNNIHQPHTEPHFSTTSTQFIKEIVLGLSDGITVPFALAAGLVNLNNSNLLLLAGLSEILAGSISMGIGGYLSTKTESDHYVSERAREAYEVSHVPEAEELEIYEIFERFGITKHAVEGVVIELRNDPDKWVEFMMEFELKLSKPRVSLLSGFTIGTSYLFGGLVPLSPYFFIREDLNLALVVSCVVTVVTLFAFGVVNTLYVGVGRCWSWVCWQQPRLIT